MESLNIKTCMTCQFKNSDYNKEPCNNCKYNYGYANSSDNYVTKTMQPLRQEEQ